MLFRPHNFKKINGVKGFSTLPDKKAKMEQPLTPKVFCVTAITCVPDQVSRACSGS
jgi:hypothetical protein